MARGADRYLSKIQNDDCVCSTTAKGSSRCSLHEERTSARPVSLLRTSIESKYKEHSAAEANMDKDMWLKEALRQQAEYAEL